MDKLTLPLLAIAVTTFLTVTTFGSNLIGSTVIGSIAGLITYSKTSKETL
ncbi:hypothetical protein [Photobacterium leiognathi]|nr:hypothetical protein [Photobacterium leiognathi]